MIKIISWNVNGIRSIIKKGLFEFINHESPDILCIQETKTEPNQLKKTELNYSNYISYWSWHKYKKGYSGTATYTKILPINEIKLNEEFLLEEGRIVALEYKDFFLLNVYFPNGGQGEERLNYKLKFYDIFLSEILKLEDKKPVIFCGDINTAHKEIDLARPKENINTSGFMPIERVWIDKVIEAKYIDAFRLFNKEPNNYTWWDYKTKARERNVGWRIDYFFVSDKLKDKLINCAHLTNQMGSDHCPIVLYLDFKY